MGADSPAAFSAYNPFQRWKAIAMSNDRSLDLTDDEILAFDVSDDALEATAIAEGPARTGTTITYFLWMCDPGE